MMDACWDNEIVCDPLDDIVYTINDDRSTPGTVTQPAVSCTFTSTDNGGNTLKALKTMATTTGGGKSGINHRNNIAQHTKGNNTHHNVSFNYTYLNNAKWQKQACCHQ